MSWAERMVARLAGFVDESVVKHSKPSREYHERALNRDTRRQVRDEIIMGEHQPGSWIERGWAEHAKREGRM